MFLFCVVQRCPETTAAGPTPTITGNQTVPARPRRTSADPSCNPTDRYDPASSWLHGWHRHLPASRWAGTHGCSGTISHMSMSEPRARPCRRLSRGSQSLTGTPESHSQSTQAKKRLRCVKCAACPKSAGTTTAPELFTESGHEHPAPTPLAT